MAVVRENENLISSYESLSCKVKEQDVHFFQPNVASLRNPGTPLKNGDTRELSRQVSNLIPYSMPRALILFANHSRGFFVSGFISVRVVSKAIFIGNSPGQ